MQVFARNYVVFTTFEYASDSFGLHMALPCWALAEVIRFSFYSSLTIKMASSFLAFLRHNAFIVLYPVGVSGELIAQVPAFKHYQ